jgi:site-specific recombinase XerD
MLARLGRAAQIGYPTHPHMLRQATGLKLANDGGDARGVKANLAYKYIAKHRAVFKAVGRVVQSLRWKD